MTAPLAPCGTYAAYVRHHRRGEPIDAECRSARNAYMADLRRKNPEINRRHGRTQKIRARALARLADLHPKEFERLLSAEYAKERTTS